MAGKERKESGRGRRVKRKNAAAAATPVAQKKRAVARAGAHAPARGDRRAKLYYAFLDFFYRVHYRLGSNLEAAMCAGKVSRAQATVLALLSQEIGGGGTIRRKDVELRLGDWFETSNSNISKLLRDLARPPRAYIEQVENPLSGREKLISLTPAGMAFIESMRGEGYSYFEETLEHMTLDEMEQGFVFFSSLFSRPVPTRKMSA